MLAGVALALAATVCFAAGNALEKRGVDRLPAFSIRHLGRAIAGLVSSPWWMAGAAVSVVGLLAQILAFAHLAISVVQSVGVAGVVLLVVVSRLGLGEHLHRRELVGLAVAVLSVVLVSLSLTRAADASGSRGATGPILVTAASTLVLALAVLLAPTPRRDDRGFVFGSAAGLLYGLSGIGAKGISTLVERHGVLGMLRGALATPFPYVFAGGWVLGLAVFQAGIQRGRVGVVGPLSSMVGSVFVVAVGTPVFGEHLPDRSYTLVLRLAGYAGIVAGSGIVAWGGAGTTVEPAAAMSVRSGD